jgi:hypothetical protein
MKFADHLRVLRWRQGEHMLMAASTQCGKSTLASMLAVRRSFVVVLASKPSDKNLRDRYKNYRRMSEWKPPANLDRERGARILLWPKATMTLEESATFQRPIFKDCLDSVSRMRGWCVIVDEAQWMSEHLRLSREIAILHHQGSSSGITMVTLTQRPAWIPKIIYSSASHAYIGFTAVSDDLRQLASLGGVDTPRVQETVRRLGKHDMLYVNPMGDLEPHVINTKM